MQKSANRPTVGKLKEKERKRRRAAVHRRYEASPKGKYRQQKANAKRRGILFLLTFAEWYGVWQDSGRWPQRGGRKLAHYVMSRKGDTGAYEVGNVEIVPLPTNASQAANKSKIVRQAWRNEYESDDWNHVHGAEGLD